MAKGAYMCMSSSHLLTGIRDYIIVANF